MARKWTTILMVIGYWACEISFRLMMYFKWDYFQLVEIDSDNEYLYAIFLTIGDLFAFIPILYGNIREKINKKKEEEIKTIVNDENTMPITDENASNNDAESNDEYNVESMGHSQRTILNSSNCNDLTKKLLILAVIFLFELVARLIFFIYHISFQTDNLEVSQKFAHDFLILIDITIRFLSHRIIFKLPCKRHHILSMVTIILIFSILIILDVLYVLFKKQYEFNNCLYYILILSISSFIYPICDTICKKFMNEKLVLPWSFLFSRGIYGSAYLLILTLILVYKSILHFTLDMFTKKNFWVVSTIYIVTGFIKAGLLINLVYKHSPTFVSFLIMSEPISGSIYEVINFIINRENNFLAIFKTVLEIIFFVLIVLTTLIYEEIIVIRKCGLEKDTEEEVRKRSENDNLLIHRKTNDFI